MRENAHVHLIDSLDMQKIMDTSLAPLTMIESVIFWVEIFESRKLNLFTKKAQILLSQNMSLSNQLCWRWLCHKSISVYSTRFNSQFGRVNNHPIRASLWQQRHFCCSESVSYFCIRSCTVGGGSILKRRWATLIDNRSHSRCACDSCVHRSYTSFTTHTEDRICD